MDTAFVKCFSARTGQICLCRTLAGQFYHKAAHGCDGTSSCKGRSIRHPVLCRSRIHEPDRGRDGEGSAFVAGLVSHIFVPGLRHVHFAGEKQHMQYVCGKILSVFATGIFCDRSCRQGRFTCAGVSTKKIILSRTAAGSRECYIKKKPAVRRQLACDYMLIIVEHLTYFLCSFYTAVCHDCNMTSIC